MRRTPLRKARKHGLFQPATGLPAGLVIFFIFAFDSHPKRPYTPALADALSATENRRDD